MRLICGLVLILLCILDTFSFAQDDVDSFTTDYVDDFSPPSEGNSSFHKFLNNVVRLLLGNNTASVPWEDSELQADQPVLDRQNLSVNSLEGLDDDEIWKRVIGSEEERGSVSKEPDFMLSDVATNTTHYELTAYKNTPIHNPLLTNVTISKHPQDSVKTGNWPKNPLLDDVELDKLLREGDGEYQRDGEVDGTSIEGQSTLAFVFDTTGSMWDDLVQVRHGAKKIMQTMLERPDKPIGDYVLVPFHDPLIGPATLTSDHKLLMQRLNEIQIYGGGDCPEASVEAIQLALQLSRPNSYIYVFTDARAKDYHLVTQVLPLIQRKQSQVVFVMTGDCGDQTHPGYQVYHKIAATSSGQVYHLNKTDVDEVLSFVRVSLQSRKVNLLSVERPAAPHGSDLPLAVDETLREFTVSVSGSNATIDVRDPGGRPVIPPQLTPLLDLQNVKVVNVKEPPPGVWTLNVGSDSEHTVRSTGLSGSDFQHGFSVIPTTKMAETYHRPLKSGFNSVLIRVTEPNNMHSLTKLQLVGLNGSVIGELLLFGVPGQPGLYNGGPFIPPNELFYLSVDGFGKDNNPVRRITATAISAQLPELPSVSILPSHVGHVGRPLTLVCRVESLVPFTVRWLKDGAAKTQTITYNQTAEVSLTIDTVTKSDAGRYICKVKIPDMQSGLVIKDTKLEVIGPPPRVTTPKEAFAQPGVLAELPCHVTSEMPYNVSWYRVLTNSNRVSSHKPSLKAITDSNLMMTHANNSLIFSTPGMSDEGLYLCTARNSGGQGSGQVYLILHQAPVIKVTSSLQEYTSGASALIDCQVLSGIPSPFVSCYKDGNPLQNIEKRSDDKGFFLNLRNLGKSDEGIYTCEAENEVGKVQGTVSLVYIEAPSAQVDPPSQLVQQGTSASLRCIATGYPPPLISWYHDNLPIDPLHQTHIQILGEGELQVSGVSIDDAGQFTCVARNKVSTAQDSGHLQVGTAPRVVHLPSDLAVPIGGSGSMLCAAIGIPVPQTIWSKAGHLIKSTRISTSEQGELFVKDAQLEDGGNYTCTVENTFGKATYQVAVKITGVVKPRLMPGSLAETTRVVLGRQSVVQLPCPLLRANPPPSRSWLKNGRPVYPHHHVANDGSLVLVNISVEDVGQYECVVSNVGGQDLLTTFLEILVPPQIERSPWGKEAREGSELRAEEGESVAIPCPVTGDPMPTVSWLRYGKRVPPSQQNGTSLVLSNLTSSHAGAYTCLAMNLAGSDTATVVLDVLVPPRISQWKGNLTVAEGQLAHLRCEVTANPPANISWFLGQRLLPFHTPTFRFIVNKTMEGQYKCIAENEIGSSTYSINLVVPVAPRIKLEPSYKIKAVAGEHLTLPCPASGDPKPTIIWTKLNSPFSSVARDDGSIVLANLTPANAGTYLCTATNIAGSSLLPISLDILVRPVISQWEAEASVLEGQIVNVNCVAEAEPPAVIHWLRNGSAIPNQGSSLKFVARREDTGIYTCVAENRAGSDTQDFPMTVVVPAVIRNTEEENIRLFVNSSETQLRCEVDGIPTPYVSWLKDNINITENTDTRLRVESDILTITKAGQDLAGLYLCHVENIAGIAQKIFKVQFYEPPIILEKSPVNITLREGDDFTLPCTATGIPPPTVGWSHSGLHLPSGFQNDELVVTPEGLLVLTQVSSASQGIYTCEAVSEAGRATRQYNIQVIVPPVSLDQSVTRVEIVESNTGVLTCPTQQGTKVQWLKDGEPISLVVNARSDDTHYDLLNDGRSLKIVEASDNDGGIYTCVATNLAGRSQASFSVDVLVHPHFINEFVAEQFDKSEGESLVLDCVVAGNPEPKVSWKRVEQGLPVTGHTTPGVLLELPSRHKLVIPALRHHHSGTYQCTAANKLGRDISRRYKVWVQAPPELDGPKEESFQVALNETIVLQCRVWGTPTPTITWDHQKDANGFQRIEGAVSAGVKTELDDRELKLRVERPSQAGLYRCTAANLLGSVFKQFNVTISEPARIAFSHLEEEVIVAVGRETELHCNVTGSPEPSVSWLHNGHVTASSNTSGLAHTLHLAPASIATAGRYTCVASNSAGVADKTYKVKVLVPPHISESRTTSGVGIAERLVAVVSGLPLRLRCPAVGQPPPNISWLRHGRLAGSGEVLTLPSVQLSDAGNYTCTASNHVGNDSKTFVVDVHVAPSFVGEGARGGGAQGIEVVSGSRLVLHCPVSAHPPAALLWLRGSLPPKANLSDNNQTLVIKSVGLEHSGRYSCIASNIAGAVEKTFDVSVLEPPSVMGDEAPAGPSGLSVMMHRKLTLECPVNGTPAPNITWFKDEEPVKGQQVSEGGRLLHLMSATPRHAGNYSCVAENPAGSKQLFIPVTVIVPLQWSEWSEWTECSKSCGGGKESRKRECGPQPSPRLPNIEYDSSDCVGDTEQSRLCNVLPCQVHGGWGEWTNWTSCSESCGRGSRRRYRTCDSPAPALGGNPCRGNDAQQETCEILPCPIQSHWGQWTEWSRCSHSCGLGKRFRGRQCLRGEDLASDCEGERQQVQTCSNRKCPVDGRWAHWGPWGQCSATCGTGLRQRQRLCSKPLYGGKPCIGDNIQVERCHLVECSTPKPQVVGPQAASLRVYGRLNGHRVEGMQLDAQITQEGPKRLVTATLSDILKAQAKWFPYLTFLMPPATLNSALDQERANIHSQRSRENFNEESRYQFATGQELVVKQRGRGVDDKGALKVDIEVVGEVPLVQPTSSIVVNPYTEDYVRTGPNSLYASSSSSMDVDGKELPFTWNRTVTYDYSRGTLPSSYLAESLSTDEIVSEYDPEDQKIHFKASSETSKKYYNDKCPLGYKLDPQYQHCADVDECTEFKRTCHQTQICENQFGSYRCLCEQGFRMALNGRKCIDIDECEERQPCSHVCHNTRGSFYCSCPPYLALSHTGLSCKAWGDLDEPEEYEEEGVNDDRDDYIEIERDGEGGLQEARGVEVEDVRCPPGLLMLNGQCSDVDECIQDEPCEQEETCINMNGTYYCLPTPCPDSNWDEKTRSCVRVCEEWEGGCSSGSVAEFVRPVAVSLNSVEPYQDLARLSPLGLTNKPLTRTTYDIVDSDLDSPLRIRIENGHGVLYAMKYFQISGIHRITIKASSYSKDYKTELYSTQFLVLLYSF